MSVVHNERTKLTATLLNTLAAASLTIGVITPGAGLMFGTSTASSLFAVVIGMVFYSFTGLVLHWLARLTLARLRRDPE